MKQVKWVKQQKMNTCGPVCVSMVSGVKESKILDLLKHRYTKYGVDIANIRWCLHKLDILCSRPQRDSLWIYSKKSILRLGACLHRNERYNDNGHYLVYFKKKFYDPYYGIRDNIFHYEWADSWIKVTDYIDIYQ